MCFTYPSLLFLSSRLLSFVCVRRAMATALVNRASRGQAISLLRSSFNFFRNESTVQASGENPTSSAKKGKRKKKNLFEVAQFLPNWGVGYHMAKTHWADVSYEITKINLYKDGRHGKAWGIAHKNGIVAADAPKKISGVHKRCWRYLPNLMKSSEFSPNTTSTSDIATTAAAETN